MAIYNRALLLHKTGDLRGAIRDYTKVLEEYPNFWTGLYRRADCYRRLGMNNQAELDEFKVFKAQMDKHIGIQPRWTKSQMRQTRKKSEIDFEKYNHVVVEDEEKVIEQEYENVSRGKVQNRKLEVEYMPMYHLSYIKYANILKPYQPEGQAPPSALSHLQSQLAQRGADEGGVRTRRHPHDAHP